MILCVTLAQRDQNLKLIIYYMAFSHKDWKLLNSQIYWLKLIMKMALIISHLDWHLPVMFCSGKVANKMQDH